MRSLATKLFGPFCLLAFLALNCVTSSAQTNVCECPSPPGGTVSCPPGYIPVCIVKDGKISSSCFGIPRAATPTDTAAAVLSTILDEKVTASETRNNEQFQEILRAGGLKTRNLSLTLRLPTTTAQATSLAQLPEVTSAELSRGVEKFVAERQKTSAIIEFAVPQRRGDMPQSHRASPPLD